MTLTNNKSYKIIAIVFVAVIFIGIGAFLLFGDRQINPIKHILNISTQYNAALDQINNITAIDSTTNEDNIHKLKCVPDPSSSDPKIKSYKESYNNLILKYEALNNIQVNKINDIYTIIIGRKQNVYNLKSIKLLCADSDYTRIVKILNDFENTKKIAKDYIEALNKLPSCNDWCNPINNVEWVVDNNNYICTCKQGFKLNSNSKNVIKCDTNLNCPSNLQLPAEYQNFETEYNAFNNNYSLSYKSSPGCIEWANTHGKSESEC